MYQIMKIQCNFVATQNSGNLYVVFRKLSEKDQSETTENGGFSKFTEIFMK